MTAQSAQLNKLPLNKVSELDYRRWTRNPKQSRSEESMEKILDAALEQLLESGADGLSVAGVADRAGYTVGALYRRFADKQSLLHALHERFAENLLVILQGVADQVELQKLSIIDLVEMLTDRAWTFAAQQQAFLQLANIFAQNDEDFLHRKELVSKAAENILRPLFLNRSNEIRHPHPERAVRFVFEQSMAIFSYRVESMQTNKILPAMDDNDFMEELKYSFYLYLGIKAPGEAKSTAQSR
jgi:AcrR family transcriptional regulator